jgi:hypothetical protein
MTRRPGSDPSGCVSAFSLLPYGRLNVPSHKHSDVMVFLHSIVGGLGSLRGAFTTILLCAYRISAAIVVEAP